MRICQLLVVRYINLIEKLEEFKKNYFYWKFRSKTIFFLKLLSSYEGAGTRSPYWLASFCLQAPKAPSVSFLPFYPFVCNHQMSLSFQILYDLYYDCGNDENFYDFYLCYSYLNLIYSPGMTCVFGWRAYHCYSRNVFVFSDAILTHRLLFRLLLLNPFLILKFF